MASVEAFFFCLPPPAVVAVFGSFCGVHFSSVSRFDPLYNFCLRKFQLRSSLLPSPHFFFFFFLLFLGVSFMPTFVGLW